MTDQNFRTLNAELGFPPEAADRLLHDRRADERWERAAKFDEIVQRNLARYPVITAALHRSELVDNHS